MLAYDWPGNVRELENFIELMVNTGLVPNRIPRDPDSIGFGLDIPVFQREAPMEFLDLESLERNHILEALRLYEGNITQCARILGIGRSTLYRKLEQYGIDCPKIERRPEMIH